MIGKREWVMGKLGERVGLNGVKGMLGEFIGISDGY